MAGGQIAAVNDSWVICLLIYIDKEESWIQVWRRWRKNRSFWIQGFIRPRLDSCLSVGMVGFELVILWSLSLQVLGIQVYTTTPV